MPPPVVVPQPQPVKMPDPVPQPQPVKMPDPMPMPMDVYHLHQPFCPPVSACCQECYEGRDGGPCHYGYGRPAPPPPCYDYYGYQYPSNRPCYVTSSSIILAMLAVNVPELSRSRFLNYSITLIFCTTAKFTLRILCTTSIQSLATFTKGLGAAILIGLAALAGAAALEDLCLAALIGTIPDLVKTVVGAKSRLELEKF
ncbi:hypothetical protein Tco_0178579 [Tanacetum coccineum]